MTFAHGASLRSCLIVSSMLGTVVVIRADRPSFDALGPAKSALLIVVAQILVAYLIEVFGWFGVEKAGFEWRKAIGAAVAIAGIVIFRWE